MRTSPALLAAEARTLLGLAWPVMLTSLNWTIVHLIDVAVVGHAGTGELDALAAARAILYVLLVGGLSSLSGILVLVARADGAGRPQEGGAVLRAGLLHAGAIGLACTILLLVAAEPMIRLAGVSPQLAPAGAAVARAMAPAFPAQFLNAAIAYFLEGASRPRRVTIVNLTILPINALLAWMLAGGHLGAPAWGAVGAAVATTIAAWIALALVAIALWTLPDAARRGVRHAPPGMWRAGAARWSELARFGLVPALAAGLELAGFSILIALSTRLGGVTAAAFQAVFSLHNLTFAIGIGMGSAAGVRVGNAVGAETPEVARSRALLAAAMAFAMVAVVATGYLVWSVPLTGLFSGDPAVRSVAAGLLVLLVPCMPFDGVQAVCLYALRSLGDQVAAGVNGILAYLVVTGGLGWLLVSLGAGAASLVAAAGAGMLAAAALQGGRLWWVTRRSGCDPADVSAARASPQS